VFASTLFSRGGDPVFWRSPPTSAYGPERPWHDARNSVALGGKADLDRWDGKRRSWLEWDIGTATGVCVFGIL